MTERGCHVRAHADGNSDRRPGETGTARAARRRPPDAPPAAPCVPRAAPWSATTAPARRLVTACAKRVRESRHVLVRVVRHRPRVRGHEADAKRHGPDCRRERRRLGTSPVDEVTVTVRANGPYKVVGPITLLDADGRAFELPPEGRRALPVRSLRTKPFCDASHKRVGFVADDAVPRQASSSAAPSRAGGPRAPAERASRAAS